jgi:FlaA1/EpsC-like NDP-sugar epimerase
MPDNPRAGRPELMNRLGRIGTRGVQNAAGRIVLTIVHRYRAIAVAAIYFALIAAANYVALWLRFDGQIPPADQATVLRMQPALLATHAVTFALFGLYRSSWLYTSIWDLRDLVCAVSIGSGAFYVVTHHGMGLLSYPRSVVAITALLSITFVGGVRLIRRMAGETLLPREGRRVLIVGAGNAGEMIARDLRRKGHHAIGFIDDDEAKQGQSIHCIRVLGTRNDLTRILATERPDEVLIAMPSAGPSIVRHFVSALQQFKVPITTLPPLCEIGDGRVSVSQVRRVAVEDLLPRLPVHLDVEHARELVEGRRVLVTGAGGSIGSELCRQVARLDPDRLIVYERYENNLYAVLNTLPRGFRTRAALGDVTDRRRLHAVMREYRPDVIFHAAAHKHVPLMELNPCEAVKNNVVGTRTVAEAAAQFGVSRFILISTDKAVNPTSLMGATKRAAELVVQAMEFRAGPRWATVRFGNVLGSTGSVVPRWQDQIAAGGPVTVTHADAERYFMLIGEAVQLILLAASVTRGGETFALEMGEQINLLKMARDLIRLSGFIPEEEIAITITGLRPGEKLSEELVGPDEHLECSPIDKILQLRPVAPPDPVRLLTQVTELGMLALRGDTRAVVDCLCRIVPTFQPGHLLAHGTERDRPVTVSPTAAPGPPPYAERSALGARPGPRRHLVVQSAGDKGNGNGAAVALAAPPMAPGDCAEGTTLDGAARTPVIPVRPMPAAPVHSRELVSLDVVADSPLKSSGRREIRSARPLE